MAGGGHGCERSSPRRLFGAGVLFAARARASTAQASRWRIVDRCESQHATEQNTSRVRLRLQVDTLQTQ